MSLINEALKKAQKQRTGESTPLSSIPSIGGEPATRIARRDKPVGFDSLMVRLGAIAAGLLVIIFGTVFTLRLINPPETAPVKPSPVTTQPAAKTPEKPPATVSPENTFNVPVASSTNPPAPASASVPAAPIAKIEPKATTTETAPAQVSVPVIKLPPPAPRMDTREVAYIEGLRIAGIRAATADSKVLMNDRVYRAGDTVEHELGLKLIAITPNSLTFENANGVRYIRSF